MKKALKIIIPLVMICGIAAIWFAQSDDGEAIEGTTEMQYPLNVTSVETAALLEHNMPIIIDFGADECIPCKEMAPVLVTLNEDMQGKAIVQFVDVWKNPEAASGFPVSVIPTQILINADGTPYVPSEELASGIEFTMYLDSTTEEHVFTTHAGGLTEEQMRLILEDMGVSA